ncbi:MAG: hypothetical protein AAGF13_09110 [Pseudomonadota bacterium]
MTLSEPTKPGLNRPLTAAALVLCLTAAIHAFLGGPEINVPVQTSKLDPVVRSVSGVVWHTLTALFLIMGAASLWAARHVNRPLVTTLLAICLAFAAIFLVVGATSLGTIWPMPQWVIFLIAAALYLWGANSNS